MKKLLSALLATLMILTFAACDGDDVEETTRAKKKTTAPEITTVDPATTTNMPDVTTGSPDTTTNVPDVTTATPAVTTENKVPDTTPTITTGAKLLNEACDRAKEYTSFVMESVSKSIIEVSGEKIETVEHTTVTLRKVDNGYEAKVVVSYDNEESVDSVAYYKDGMIYTSYEDTKICYELSTEEFLELAGLQDDDIDYSVLFNEFSVTGYEGGITVINATEFTDKGKDYVASIVGDLGDVGITYPEFSIAATTNADGDMTSLAMKLVVEANSEGVTARVSLDVLQEYVVINDVNSIDFPSFEDYELLEDME